jgi:hypothetical protein
MADGFLFRFSGQAGYEVDTGRRKKIRVVFGMIDENRTSMGWYLFSSDGVEKSKKELANPDKMPTEEFGHRGIGSRDIPHRFKKKIGLGELAIHPKGTPASLTLETSATNRFIDCRIDQLTTKAKEVVGFPFGLQSSTELLPSRTGKFHGKVMLLDTALFTANQFTLGPQGQSKIFITGPGF